MYLSGYLSSFMQEQAKLYDYRRRVHEKEEESEADNTSFFLLGNQIMASCRELHDFMKLTAVKQQLLTELTGVSKVAADL